MFTTWFTRRGNDAKDAKNSSEQKEKLTTTSLEEALPKIKKLEIKEVLPGYSQALKRAAQELERHAALSSLSMFYEDDKRIPKAPASHRLIDLSPYYVRLNRCAVLIPGLEMAVFKPGDNGGTDNKIELWDLKSGNYLRTLTEKKGEQFLSLLAADNFLISLSRKCKPNPNPKGGFRYIASLIRIWDYRACKEVRTIELLLYSGDNPTILKSDLRQVKFSRLSNGNFVTVVASNDSDSTMTIWDQTTGQVIENSSSKHLVVEHVNGDLIYEDKDRQEYSVHMRDSVTNSDKILFRSRVRDIVPISEEYLFVVSDEENFLWNLKQKSRKDCLKPESGSNPIHSILKMSNGNILVERLSNYKISEYSYSYKTNWSLTIINPITDAVHTFDPISNDPISEFGYPIPLIAMINENELISFTQVGQKLKVLFWQLRPSLQITCDFRMALVGLQPEVVRDERTVTLRVNQPHLEVMNACAKIVHGLIQTADIIVRADELSWQCDSVENAVLWQDVLIATYTSCSPSQKIQTVLLDEQYEKENTVKLFEAIRANDLAKVVYFIKAGAKVNACNDKGELPLIFAIHLNFTEIILFLLKQTSDVNLVDYLDRTALYMAAGRGNEKVVAELLQEEKIEVCYAEKHTLWTPLHKAVDRGYKTIVASLIVKDVSLIYRKTTTEQTVLHLVAKKGREDIAELLLQYGASANSEDQQGFTPLHLAAASGHLKIVIILLSWGASMVAKTNSRVTPLELAEEAKKSEVVTYLKDLSLGKKTLPDKNTLPAIATVEYILSDEKESKENFPVEELKTRATLTECIHLGHRIHDHKPEINLGEITELVTQMGKFVISFQSETEAKERNLQEHRFIQQNTVLQLYYNKLRQELNQFIAAAVVICSGKIPLTANKKQVFFDVITSIGKTVPGVGILFQIFSSLTKFGNESAQIRELYRLQEHFQGDISQANRIVNQFALQLTIAKSNEILEEQKQSIESPLERVSGLIYETQQWINKQYRSVVRDEQIKSSEVLALKHAAFLLQNLMSDKYCVETDVDLVQLFLQMVMQDNQYQYRGLPEHLKCTPENKMDQSPERMTPVTTFKSLIPKSEEIKSSDSTSSASQIPTEIQQQLAEMKAKIKQLEKSKEELAQKVKKLEEEKDETLSAGAGLLYAQPEPRRLNPQRLFSQEVEATQQLKDYSNAIQNLHQTVEELGSDVAEIRSKRLQNQENPNKCSIS